MKIVTAYNFRGSDPEILDDERITDGTQYMSISEVIRRSAHGEVLELKDYSNDLPIDRFEKFDIYDNVERIKKEAEKFMESIKEKSESSPTPPVEQTAPSDPQPTD